MATRLQVLNFGLSLDGFGAGSDQDAEHPLGVGGEVLHEWAFATRHFRSMVGDAGGEDGVDDEKFAAGFANVGAWIIGRNMFGPIRGAWGDNDWQGWWGTEPPFRCPVFVLTHHPRPTVTLKGGSSFHFVTDGLQACLDRAKDAAAGKDVRLGGGVDVIRQYLEARLVDDLHLAIAPILQGRGEALYAGLNLRSLGYVVTRTERGARAIHVTIERSKTMSIGWAPIML